MSIPEKTWGWELATNADALVKVLGGYPSFHDSAVRSLCMRRGRETREGLDGRELPGTQTRDAIDVRLEYLADAQILGASEGVANDGSHRDAPARERPKIRGSSMGTLSRYCW